MIVDDASLQIELLASTLRNLHSTSFQDGNDPRRKLGNVVLSFKEFREVGFSTVNAEGEVT